MTARKTQKTDITIVGGGMVGLTAALAFSRLGLTVCVLEQQAEVPKEAVGLNARAIALSAASMQMLQALDLWREVDSVAASIRKIHVSSQGHWGVTRFDADKLGLPALGCVAESTALIRRLFERACEDERITLLMSARFDFLQDDGESLFLNYRQGDDAAAVKTRLVIAADGAHSALRESLGISSQTIDYGQSVMLANVEIDKAHEGVAFERFCPGGPLAMLPLTGNRYAMVWTDSPDAVEQLIQLDDATFLERLQQHFGYRLGRLKTVGRRFAVPLQRTRASQLVNGRCILLGNAANTLHPVAGQGLNLAMRDIAELFDVLKGAKEALAGGALGPVLADYATRRGKDHDQIIRFGDGLVQLFSNDLPVLNHARSAALGILDIVPPVKSALAMLGMGFAQPAASLMRGEIRHG